MKKISIKGLFVVGLVTAGVVINTSVASADETEQSVSSSHVLEEVEKSLSSSNVLESSTEETKTTDSTEDTTAKENNAESAGNNQIFNDQAISDEKIKEMYDMDSRRSIMTFEQYKEYILLVLSLDNSAYNGPGSLIAPFAAGNERDQIVAEAKKHLGKPYSQAQGERMGPNKFDCSGLTRYVFLKVTGRNIGDWTVPQESAGTLVNVSQSNISKVKPGDLLFWGNKGSTYHVAIYIGNQQYIHAPSPGKTVEISPIWWNDFKPTYYMDMKLKETVPQGPYIADGRYVTITKKGYSLWSSFDWNKKDSTDNLFNKTYQAKGRYQHSNGSTYFSLYDSNGTWKGYLNAEAASVASGKQGIWLNNDRSVSITKKGYTIWGEINNFSNQRGNTNDHYQKNYYAQGKYNHFNGAVYLSLYDDQMKWVGYLNSEAAAVKQMTYTEVSKTVMVNRENKTIDTLPWGQSGYSRLSSSPQYLGKVVSITQDSGSYAFSPELKGWIDKKGITEVIKTNCQGTIKNSGYTIDPVPWYDGVTHIGATKDHLNKSVTVSAKNGSYYYVANLGWIDKKAFNPELQKAVDAVANTNTVTTKKLVVTEVNRSATVLGNGKTVDTLPWGTKGYGRVASSNDFKGKTIRLTQDSGSYVFSPDLKGWVDKKGLTIK